MTKYLISFPSEAMRLSDEDLALASVDSHRVIEEAKAAGVYVFGGGVAEQVGPVRVCSDGSILEGAYPDVRITGGLAVLEVPTREEAIAWARRMATACRCPQELREFGYDPAS